MRHAPLHRLIPLTLAVLLAAVVAGCGLTTAQKTAIGRFSRSTAAIGETTASELVHMRDMTIRMNAATYAIAGPGDGVIPLNDLDHNFTVSNTDTVAKAATAVQSYGELLQALVDDTQQKELKSSADNLVASLQSLPGATLSTEQGDLIAGAIQRIGGLYIEWKKKEAVKTIVPQARDAVNRVCRLLATEFDPQQADALGSQFQLVTARLQGEAGNAAQNAKLLGERAVAVAAYRLSFDGRRRREEVFTKISRAAHDIQQANESLVTALASESWLPRTTADIQQLAQSAKELVDVVRMLK